MQNERLGYETLMPVVHHLAWRGGWVVYVSGMNDYNCRCVTSRVCVSGRESERNTKGGVNGIKSSKIKIL